ncbi:MAG: hypothetical protein ABJQ80_02820, partial [Lentilitoribacter sp.]
FVIWKENFNSKINFNLISKKKRDPIGKRRIHRHHKMDIKTTWNNAARHTTPSRPTATSVDESDGWRCRVSATASIILFWWRRIGSCHSQGVLGGRGEPSSAT